MNDEHATCSQQHQHEQQQQLHTAEYQDQHHPPSTKTMAATLDDGRYNRSHTCIQIQLFTAFLLILSILNGQFFINYYTKSNNVLWHKNSNGIQDEDTNSNHMRQAHKQHQHPINNPPNTCPQLTWHDEFNDTTSNQLNTTKWEVKLGNGCQYGWWMCGWGNNEVEWYTPDNLQISNGTLQIIARKELDGRYTSARLESRPDPALNVNGRFEARMRFPTDNGLWPAFWMLPDRTTNTNNTHAHTTRSINDYDDYDYDYNDDYGPWPRSGEIDIMENIGNRPSTYSSCVHYGNSLQEHYHIERRLNLPHNQFFAKEFHTFAVERQEDGMRFLMNDVVFLQVSKNDIQQGTVWPFDTAPTTATATHTHHHNHPFHFILNMAVGWPVVPTDAVFPAVMEVDYVRVYDQPLPSVRGARLLSWNRYICVYEVLNAAPLQDDNDDGSTTQYSWSVPPGARIWYGQNRSRVFVNLDGVVSSVANNINPNDDNTDTKNKNDDTAVQHQKIRCVVTSVCGTTEIHVDVEFVWPAPLSRVLFWGGVIVLVWMLWRFVWYTVYNLCCSCCCCCCFGCLLHVPMKSDDDVAACTYNRDHRRKLAGYEEIRDTCYNNVEYYSYACAHQSPTSYSYSSLEDAATCTTDTAMSGVFHSEVSLLNLNDEDHSSSSSSTSFYRSGSELSLFEV